MQIVSDSKTNWLGLGVSLFASPAIAMVAWGAFVEMSQVNLPKFGYWEFFMLHLVIGLFKTYIPQVWNIKDKI